MNSTRPYDEMRAVDGSIRTHYRAHAEWLAEKPQDFLPQKQREANALYTRMGITFAVYGDDSGTERSIPFDIIPRIIRPAAWQIISDGEMGSPLETEGWQLLSGDAIPERAVQCFDAQREPSPRPHFLSQWLHHPAGDVLALVDAEGVCHGFGRIRPCLLLHGEGWRIGPLMAETVQAASQLLQGLLHRHAGVVLIDAPGGNAMAAPLLKSLQLLSRR